MKIETKYNIGDEVWFFSYHKPVSAKIVGIKLCGSRNTLTEYLFLDYAERLECAVFPTKEELLKWIEQ